MSLWRQVGFAVLALVLIVGAAMAFMPGLLGGKPMREPGGAEKKLGAKLPADKVYTVAMGDEAQSLNLAEAWKGFYGILVFYPMDQTPGCTIQLCTLRDQYPRLVEENIKVAAVNPADVESHKAFAKKHKFPFPVIVDEERALAKALGVGATMGVNSRTVLIVDPENTVFWAQDGMPKPEEMIEAVKRHRAEMEAVAAKNEALPPAEPKSIAEENVDAKTDELP